MAMRYKCKLACDLIRTHFGEVVEKVCRCLVYRGPLALAEIARFTEMNMGQLRNCLLVLVQHSCVQGYKGELEAVGQASPKVFTCYIAAIDQILHRMRFPKFLVIVRDELGEEAESLVAGLLEHGRLTLEQVIQRAAAQRGKVEAEVGTLQKQAFAALVRSRYVEHCPASEPTLACKVLEPPKKKKSIKSARNLLESEEERIMCAAYVPNAERYSMPSSLEDFGETIADAACVPFTEPLTSGQKRKRDTFDLDTNKMAAIDEKEVLWRPNYEEFIRKLRHQACVAQVKTSIDSGAAVVLEAMLDSARSQEITSKQQISAPLSMSVIVEAVTRIPEGYGMTVESIREALHEMSSESLGFLSQIREAGSSYVINMDKIIEIARRNEVEGIVLQRFGRESCRIYRLLMMKGQMEQKQEVAKTSEHSAQKSFYFWNINWKYIQDLMLDDMYHAAANLGRRLGHELEQEQEMLELLQQIQSAKAAGTESHVNLTQRQHEQVKRIRRKASLLESSLLHLDSAILLFDDF